MSISIRDILIPFTVFASTTLAAIAFSGVPAVCMAHNAAGLTDQGYGVTVIGPNGNLIGAAPNQSIRSRMQRLPE
jgi:hypothetical protein